MKKPKPVFKLIILLTAFRFVLSAQPPGEFVMGAAAWENTQSELWHSLMDHDEGWFSSAEALRIAENIMAYQRGSGGWPKNIDMVRPLTQTEQSELAEYKNEPLATLDNGATVTQLFFLKTVIQAQKDQRMILAFLRGLDYLLEAQYNNGGWPQFYPLRKGYYSEITFNDHAMTGVLNLLYDIIHNNTAYHFIGQKRLDRVRSALEKGIQCILQTQWRMNDLLTGWCAQYDPVTLQPAKARNYELPSLASRETVGILQFLMLIREPSTEIIASVQAGVRWLDEIRIEGKRIVREKDPESPTGFNKKIIADSGAPSLWARFYDLQTNEPFYSDRDGLRYSDLSQISSERRNKYGWLGYWPQRLLDNDYPSWQTMWAPGKNVLK